MFNFAIFSQTYHGHRRPHEFRRKIPHTIPKTHMICLSKPYTKLNLGKKAMYNY